MNIKILVSCCSHYGLYETSKEGAVFAVLFILPYPHNKLLSSALLISYSHYNRYDSL